MSDKESKRIAIENQVDEIKLTALQLKYPSKHLDIFLPLCFKLASQAFRLKVIQSQPIAPSGLKKGGLAILSDGERSEIIVSKSGRTFEVPKGLNI